MRRLKGGNLFVHCLSNMLLVALASWCFPASAQDRFELFRFTKCEVDHTNTYTSVSSGRLVFRALYDSDPQLFNLSRFLNSRAEWTEKCLEADQQGKAKKVHVHIKDWTEQRRGSRAAILDDQLHGVDILVTGSGKDRTWVSIDSAQSFSSSATQWLDSKFGPKRTLLEQLEGVLPKHKVAIGEFWQIDPSPFWENTQALQVKDPRGKGTLLSVSEKNIAQIRFEITAPIQGAPFGITGTLVPWKKGGVMGVMIEAEIALNGPLGVVKSEYRTSTEGQFLAPDPERQWDMTLEGSWVFKDSIEEGEELRPRRE